MKFKILTLIAAGLVLLSSCAKEVIDPELEIYVTTIASENWKTADINIGNMRFAIIFEEGNQGWGSLQETLYGKNSIQDYTADLEETQSTLIYNGSNFDIERLAGMKLDLYNLELSNTNNSDVRIQSPYYDFVELDELAKIENGKRYKIDFIINLDEQVYEENGSFVYDPSYKIEIIEL